MARGGKRAGAGRPKGAVASATIEQKGTLSELARSHTETAVNVLVSVARGSDSDAARVSAASAILDRGYGKAPQSMELSGPEGGPIETVELTATEAGRRIAFALARAQRDKSTDTPKD